MNQSYGRQPDWLSAGASLPDAVKVLAAAKKDLTVVMSPEASGRTAIIG